MRFRIIGTNRDTGEDVRMTIDADDHAAAERWAGENNVAAGTIEVDTVVPQQSSLLEHPRAAAAPEIPQARKATSGLGIAALAIGTVACLVSWIPFCGVLSAIPVAIAGLLLAFIALAISLVGGKSGAGVPIAGGLLCALAIVIAITSTTITNRLMNNSLEAQKRAQATNQDVGPEQPDQIFDEDGWASAAHPVTQGTLRLTVDSVQVGNAGQLKITGEHPAVSEDPVLVVRLRLRNTSDSQKMEYLGWGGEEASIARDFATVQDNFGNAYRKITLGPATRVAGQVLSESIYPGKEITDILLFEQPVGKTEFLKLELPAANFGGTGMLRLRIPAAMIKR